MSHIHSKIFLIYEQHAAIIHIPSYDYLKKMKKKKIRYFVYYVSTSKQHYIVDINYNRYYIIFGLIN